MAYINKSKSDDWATPKELYDLLDRKYCFDFDPCPLKASFDGLSINWGKRNFVNPPYSKNKLFLEKGYKEFLKGNLSVFLIPSRTDTKYFHDYCMKASELCFIKGRLRFGNEESAAPFASVLVIFNPEDIQIVPRISVLDQSGFVSEGQTMLDVMA